MLLLLEVEVESELELDLLFAIHHYHRQPSVAVVSFPFSLAYDEMLMIMGCWSLFYLHFISSNHVVPLDLIRCPDNFCIYIMCSNPIFFRKLLIWMKLKVIL